MSVGENRNIFTKYYLEENMLGNNPDGKIWVQSDYLNGFWKLKGQIVLFILNAL